MTAPVRYPAPDWNDELDARERSFSEESWESEPPMVVERRNAHGVPHPFSWLVMLLCPIVALCAVGLMVGVGG